MSNLREYLVQKRAVLLEKRAGWTKAEPEARPISARVSVEGRSGVRRVRIRDFQIIIDSPPDFAGYGLGPTAPELTLGALGSCLAHTFLIQAADRQIPLDSLHVDVTANIDPRAGTPGNEHVPFNPHNISYTVHIDSPASAEEIEALKSEVERVCPVLNLYRNPQTITGVIAPVRERELAAAVR